MTSTVLLTVAPTPFPSDIISAAHGALYGFLPGALLNWLILWLAVFVEVAIGRRLGTDFNIEAEVARLPAFLRKFPVGHPAFLILGRQVPLLGSNITTLLPSAMGVPVSRIAWCSAIGIIPGAFALAAAGAGLLQL